MLCLISNTLPQSSLHPSTVLHHRHLLQTTCYRPPATDHLLQTTCYRPPATDHLLQTISCYSYTYSSAEKGKPNCNRLGTLSRGRGGGGLRSQYRIKVDTYLRFYKIHRYVITKIRKYVHAYTRTHLHAYTCTRTLTHLHTYTYTYTCTHLATHVHTYTYIHKLSYTHIYTRTYKCRSTCTCTCTCSHLNAYGINKKTDPWNINVIKLMVMYSLPLLSHLFLSCVTTQLVLRLILLTSIKHY